MDARLPHVAALNEAIAALTSVKSERVEDRDKEMQSLEDSAFVAGYQQGLHDFANNSEAIKENAIKFAKVPRMVT